MLRTKEVAKILNLSVSHLSHWAKKNNIAYCGLDDKKIYLWSDDDIARFLCRNKKVGKPKKTCKSYIQIVSSLI